MHELEARFRDGVRRGRDPRNENADGQALTTLDSSWWDEECARCGHTFREGDAVQIDVRDGRTEVHHLMDLPPCTAGTVAGTEADPAVRQRFYDALTGYEQRLSVEDHELRAGVVARRLPPDHPLVMRRSTCTFCGVTVRPYEAVVICPCALVEKPCESLIHHDPAGGLACYDLAFRMGYPERCQIFFSKIGPPAPSGPEPPGALAARLAAGRGTPVPTTTVIIRATRAELPDG